MNKTGYISPALRCVGFESGEELLQSSVIKITRVDGVTVAPWLDVEPVGKEDDEDDNAFDVSFE